jgi:hypothetical protein
VTSQPEIGVKDEWRLQHKSATYPIYPAIELISTNLRRTKTGHSAGFAFLLFMSSALTSSAKDSFRTD